MVEKISVQIALEGGDLIARQLADIGQAGQKAFTDISKSAEQVGGFKNIKPEEVTTKLKEMGVTGVDAIDKIQRAVQQAGRLETLVQGITTAENALLAMARAAPIVGVAIVGAMIAAAKATIKFAETIQKASAEAVKLGLNLEQFQQQQRGLEQLGLSMKSAAEGLANLGKAADQAKLAAVTKAFTDLQEAATRGFGGIGTQQLKTLEEAAKGVGPAADLARKSLVELGIARQQLDVEFGKPFPEGAVRSLQNFITQTGSAEAGMQAFLANLRQMPDGLDRTRLAIAGLGDAAGTEFIQGLRLAEGSMGSTEAKAEQLRQATNGLSSAWANFGSLTFSPAIVQGLNLATAALQGLDTLLSKISWSAFGTAAFVALNPLPNLLELLGRAIVELGSKLTGITWDSIANLGVQAWDALTGAIGRAIDALLRFLGLKSQAAAPAASGGGGEGMASGGLLGGRGSGTSDSNLAWVSRGEHIMPARAVAQPGVLAFLEALRRSGGNLSAVLNGMGRFALGGMVPQAMPAFATGGLAGGMSNVTIQFPGLPAIGGLRASSDVVDQLHRVAALAQVRSGGRKPSRYS